MNIPLIDTPAAIQIIPRAIIEEQGARRLTDVVRNVSGVQSGGNGGGRGSFLIIRGFMTFRIAKDGFLPAMSFFDGQSLGLANVERVEVLKGPASVLYGAANPGGWSMSLPRNRKPNHATVSPGAPEVSISTKADIDLNQPLTDDGKLLGRLNASYKNTDSFRDYFIKSERVHLAPSLRWLPTSRTTVDLDVEYNKQDRQFDYELIAVGDKALALPRERFLGERGDYLKSDGLRVQASLDHRLDEVWSLRTLARFSDTRILPN